MRNVETKITGKKLTITVDLSKELGPSKSGLNTVIASSQGNVGLGDDKGTFMGLNIYRKPS